MNRIVIYTCLVGNYDKLKQPAVIDSYFDYVCFSNDLKQDTFGVWQVKKIPYICDDNTRLSRYVKINPHLVFPEYDYSVWIDANIQIIKKEFYDVIRGWVRKGGILAQVPHVERDCVYEEIIECLKRGKVKGALAKQQYMFLLNNHYPKHNGLYENNLIVRKHNVDWLKKTSEEWWELYLQYTRRDQFSLCYIYWKYKIKPDFIFGVNKNTRNVDFLQMTPFHNHSVRSIKAEILHLYNKYIVNRVYILLLKYYN